MQRYNLLTAKWKNFDFNRTKIERKFRDNEVEHTTKFAKISNENERISFVHFREFRLKKISMETLISFKISFDHFDIHKEKCFTVKHKHALKNVASLFLQRKLRHRKKDKFWKSKYSKSILFMIYVYYIQKTIISPLPKAI